MNKAELVSAMAKDMGITKDIGKGAELHAILGRRRHPWGEKVTLVGFGTFSSVQRKARTGRNPQTGSEIKIPAKRVPKFAPGVSLRDAASKGRARKK